MSAKRSLRAVTSIAWFGIARSPFNCGNSEPAAFWAMHELPFSNRRGCPPNTTRLPNRPRGVTSTTADSPSLRVRSNTVRPTLGQKTHNRTLNRCHKDPSFPANSRMNRPADRDASGAERRGVLRKHAILLIFSHGVTEAQSSSFRGDTFSFFTPCLRGL